MEAGDSVNSLSRFFAWKKETLVLTLLVKNEADIILDNVLFHYAKGVDHIIVTDNGSTDGTLEILKNLEKDGFIDLLEEKLYNQDKIVNKMGAIAKDKYHATVLIHADADEFWNPVKGNSLKKTFWQINQPAVLVDRKDVLPTPESKDQAFPQDSLNIITKHLISEDVSNDSQETSLFLYRLPPKVMFSIKQGLKKVGLGNHNLTEGRNPEVTDRIIIFHFPFKSTARFEEKVIIAGKSLEKVKTTPESMWHWKRWYREYKSGTLPDEVKILIPRLKTIPDIEYESFDYPKRVLKSIKRSRKLWRYRAKQVKIMHNSQVRGARA